MTKPRYLREKTEVRCHKCGQRWKTVSEYMYVTCPSCRSKVRNPRWKQDTAEGGELVAPSEG